MRALGFREFRVRHLGERGAGRDRPGEMARLGEPPACGERSPPVRGAGYATVVIDPEGYRRGRLNEALRLRVVAGA